MVDLLNLSSDSDKIIIGASALGSMRSRHASSNDNERLVYCYFLLFLIILMLIWGICNGIFWFAIGATAGFFRGFNKEHLVARYE